ncbi:MAG TPA: RNA methyltransferase [Candidatus Paceibacterota bacterium]
MRKKEILVVLDNIRSRENVGSIFRTADAAGASKIYLCGITPTPPHEKISKTALGAEKWIPWEYCKQTWRLMAKLKGEGTNIVALEQTKESKNVFKFRPKFPLVLILGNEVRGLSPQILKYCDKKIYIPMRGRKESLNIAVAFGIAVYQLNK